MGETRKEVGVACRAGKLRKIKLACLRCGLEHGAIGETNSDGLLVFAIGGVRITRANVVTGSASVSDGGDGVDGWGSTNGVVG